MSETREPGHAPGRKQGRRSAAVAGVARVARATRVARVARATRGIRRSRLVPGRGSGDGSDRGHTRRPASADSLSLRQWVPAIVTFIALGCGLAALEAARVGSWDLALRLILVAAVADGIDGTVARKLGAVSGMGKQLDSLSDVIAFGVAPAFLFATYHADASDALRFAVAAAFVGAGTYRLARFHAQSGNEMFQGLPITIAGAALAVAVAGPVTGGAAVTAGIAVLLAVLMVSRHPFPSFSRWRWTLFPAVLASIAVIAMWPTTDTVAILAGVLLGCYVLWALLASIAGTISQRRANLGEAIDDV